MPVKFEGESEYDRQYKWTQSRKSGSFQPSAQQNAPFAGVPSTDTALPQEPAIQRRKKTTPLSRTLPTHFCDTDSAHSATEDDYFLLGDTSKFASNVQYRNSRKALKDKLSVGKTYKISTKHRDENAAPVDVVEPVKLDREPVEPLNISVPQDGHKHRDTENKPRKSPEKTAIKRGHTGKPKKPDFSRPSPPKKSSAPPTRPAETRGDSQNQAVQTAPPTVEKKVQADTSNKGQKEDLALQYRAGVKPDRPVSIKRLSEYQKQFQWKDGVVSSPLLAADQVVHKSASVLKPHVTLPRHSEYQTQFQEPPKQSYTPVVAPKPDGASPTKVSKSVPEPLPEVAKSANLTDKEKRLLRESSNPQKPFAPHGKHRRTKSEYSANYQPPAAYMYVDGTWKGAKPAHITNDKSEATPDSAKSWFQEVLELRQKADEYRKRALGTHFSRMHTAQILAKNADLWDTASETSRTLSALSLETGSQVSSQHRAPKPGAGGVVPRLDRVDRVGADSHPVRRASQLAEEDDSVQLSTASRRSLCGSELETPVNSDRDSTPRAPRIPAAAPAPALPLTDESDDEGRIPTPRLKTHPVYHRHHLDITTPSVGGALLTSPAPPVKGTRAWHDDVEEEISTKEEEEEDRRAKLTRPRKEVRQHHRHGYELEPQCTCGADLEPEPAREVPRHHETRPTRSKISPVKLTKTITKPAQVPPVSIHRAVTPTYGKPTSDSQPLLDEDASEDRILATKYVAPSPSKYEAARVDRLERLGLDVPRTIDERFGETYISPLRRQYDDEDEDVLSTSMRSVASSCSLASDTLERARHRQDFWSKQSKKVGTE